MPFMNEAIGRGRSVKSRSARRHFLMAPTVDSEARPHGMPKIFRSPELGEEAMSAIEPLCDLHMIKAEYREVSTGHSFHIRVTSGPQKLQFDISEKDGELFAAELEVLAAIIKSRVIRARIIGEEAS